MSRKGRTSVCGIVGYIGAREAVPILIEGLRKLEYRGYDSAGIAVFDGQKAEVRKRVGKLKNLEDLLLVPLPGSIGIGHTRWATHGIPSDVNAHPHGDCTGRFVVVHNGIIENYLDLRHRLSAEGHGFVSETDTEVVAHLIEQFYGGDLEAAVHRAVGTLEGSYALGVLSAEDPSRLIAVRKDSPLIVGLGEGENYLASDVPAILSHTRRIYVLEDGEMAVVARDSVRVVDRSGAPVDKKLMRVEWDAVMAQKAGFEHYMLKEICEQPRALQETVRGRLDGPRGTVNLDELDLPAELATRVKRVAIAACGTAYYASLVGKQLMEKMARLPVEADLASEFRYRDPLVGPDTLVVVVSQSGETADSLAALREAKRRGARVLAVCNVVGSSVAREADGVLFTRAGPEIAVASTKAYTAQLVALCLLAIHLGVARGTLEPSRRAELVRSLQELPRLAEVVLERAEEVKKIAEKYCDREHVFFIGRGMDYAVALEGALKLKEISYIHAEAYAAGELKHGTLALVVKGVPVIALLTQTQTVAKMVSNVKEVEARGADVVAVAYDGDEWTEEVADEVIRIPRTDEFVAPILAVIPLQLLAYYAARARGCDIDQPRHLAKSVTVE